MSSLAHRIKDKGRAESSEDGAVTGLRVRFPLPREAQSPSAIVDLHADTCAIVAVTGADILRTGAHRNQAIHFRVEIDIVAGSGWRGMDGEFAGFADPCIGEDIEGIGQIVHADAVGFQRVGEILLTSVARSDLEHVFV